MRLPTPPLRLLKTYKACQAGKTTPKQDERLRVDAAKLGHDMRSLDAYTIVAADPNVWAGGERVIHRDEET